LLGQNFSEYYTCPLDKHGRVRSWEYGIITKSGKGKEKSERQEGKIGWEEDRKKCKGNLRHMRNFSHCYNNGTHTHHWT